LKFQHPIYSLLKSYPARVAFAEVMGEPWREFIRWFSKKQTHRPGGPKDIAYEKEIRAKIAELDENFRQAQREGLASEQALARARAKVQKADMERLKRQSSLSKTTAVFLAGIKEISS
jgi:hypothetical protein